MFFKQIRRNAAKSRETIGLFFGSLIIAIVSFYTLLSLGSQDVILFLKTLESDAVGKLMMLIPVVYMVSLFFVFFLVYFAYRYHLDDRQKEFGLYLLMGMKKSSLFAMLMGETFWNSMISILAGLPIALLLTEGISLATAKVAGLGILGHKISFSLPAVLGTAAGFLAVQLIAMALLSAELSTKEPADLLRMDAPVKQAAPGTGKSIRFFLQGILLLALAYLTGLFLLTRFPFLGSVLVLILGIRGTFLFYRGSGAFIGRHIRRKSPSKAGLYTFTGRQLQENVLYQHRSLAVSSLLLLMALACISYGIGVASGRGSDDIRSVDFSMEGSGQEISGFWGSDENAPLTKACYPMLLSQFYGSSHSVSWSGFVEALHTAPASDLRDNMIDNFTKGPNLYLISLSSYNALLESVGKTPIRLEADQAALYTSMNDSRDFIDILEYTLESGPFLKIDGLRYDLLPQLYYDKIVADRKITLYCGLIVSDEMFQELAASSREPFCWNALLNDDAVKDNGLMQAIMTVGSRLDRAGIPYESYLGGIGRNLFFTVAGSYLTIYLGVLFAVIANTVIGLKFLIQQRNNKHRYMTLLLLGANIPDLCASARKQIRIFFALVVSVASVSSVFAVFSMFSSYLRLPAGASISKVAGLTALAFVLFLALEFLYIRIVERISSREIDALRFSDRGSVN